MSDNKLLSKDLMMSGGRKELKKYVKVYKNDTLLLTKEITDFSQCYIDTRESRSGCGLCVINGVLYHMSGGVLRQVNGDTNWKLCSGVGGVEKADWAIKTDGTLYKIRYMSGIFFVDKNTKSPVKGWTKVTGGGGSNDALRTTGLNGGYIYSLYSAPVKFTQVSGIPDVTGSHDYTPSGTNCLAFFKKGDKFCWYRNNSYSDEAYPGAGFKACKYYASATAWRDYSVSCIRSDDKWGAAWSTGSYVTVNTTVKKITSGYFSGNNNYAIGTDGCLYHATGGGSNHLVTPTKVDSNTDWVNVIGWKTLHYATRAGKLYKVQGTTLTEITSAGKGVVDIAGSTQNNSIMLVYSEE